MVRLAGLVRRGAVLTGAVVVGCGLLAGPASAESHQSSGSSPGLVPATATAISAHAEKAHLERSPMTQVHDAQKTGDYVALHEAWLQAVATPAREGAGHIAGSAPSAVVSHVQQTAGSAGGVSDPDAFVLTQTTWVQGGLKPTEDVVTGTPC
jgi:hypothetical protein